MAWITGHGDARGDLTLEEQVDEILDDREGASDGSTPGRRGGKSLGVEEMVWNVESNRRTAPSDLVDEGLRSQNYS